jgi:hypothetical protein
MDQKTQNNQFRVPCYSDWVGEGYETQLWGEEGSLTNPLKSFKNWGAWTVESTVVSDPTLCDEE